MRTTRQQKRGCAERSITCAQESSTTAGRLGYLARFLLRLCPKTTLMNNLRLLLLFVFAAATLQAQTERISKLSHSSKSSSLSDDPNHTLGVPPTKSKSNLITVRVDSIVFINDSTCMQYFNVGSPEKIKDSFATDPKVSLDSLKKIYPGIKLVGFEKKTYKAAFSQITKTKTTDSTLWIWLLSGFGITTLFFTALLIRRKKLAKVTAGIVGLLFMSVTANAQTERISKLSHSSKSGSLSDDRNHTLGLPSKAMVFRLDSIVFINDSVCIQYSNFGQGPQQRHPIANDPKISRDSLQKLYPKTKLVGFEKKTYQAGFTTIGKQKSNDSALWIWLLSGVGITTLLFTALLFRRNKLTKVTAGIVGVLFMSITANAQTERISALSHSGNKDIRNSAHTLGGPEIILEIDSIVFINDTTVMQYTNFGNHVVINHPIANDPKISLDSLKKIYPGIKLVGFEKKTYKSGMLKMSTSKNTTALPVIILTSCIAAAWWFSRRNRTA
jgi:hypothetical protein